MRTIVIATSYNEARLMPVFVAHYKGLGADIHILDNHSTDGSDELARELGCTVEKFGNPDAFEVTSTARMYNRIWRKFRRSHDVAILVDMDELVLLREPLTKKMAAITRCEGYNLHNEDYPQAQPLHEQPQFWFGSFMKAYCKPCVLNLRKLRFLRVEPGMHNIRRSWPRYRHRDPQANAPVLFHLRFVGGLAYLYERTRERAERKQRGTDPANGYGVHYFHTLEEFEAKLERGRAKAHPLPLFAPCRFDQ